MQFISPPQSPDELSPVEPESLYQGANFEAHPASPPPPGLPNASIDPKALLSGEPIIGEAIRNNAANIPIAAPRPIYNPVVAVPVPEDSPALNQPPINPFARTLASIEPGHEIAAEKALPNGAVKGALDVDAFKRLLLTGNASPVPQSPSPASQQAFFDPLHDISQDSPRSSYDEPRSEDEEDDEQSILVPEAQSKRQKPPPPKHRHGRPITQNGPQTVSFDDFDASFNPSPVQQPEKDFLRPTLNRSVSDLNKPLPPPPRPMSLELAPDVPIKDAQIELLDNSTSTTLKDEIAARLAPPPPIPRRQNITRTTSTGSRPRSGSNLAHSFVPDASIDGVRDSTIEAIPSQPPPPPSRDPIITTAPTLHTSRDRSDSASSSQILSRQITDTVHKPTLSKMRPPPPPPSRNPAKATPPLIRTPSTQSSTSITPRRSSATTAGPVASIAGSSTGAAPSTINSAPPPPPPPRRSEARNPSFDLNASDSIRRASTESRRSSREQARRTSGQSFETGRTPSISSLQLRQVDEGMSDAPLPPLAKTTSQDVLADLSAFQREVDELRMRGRGTG